MGKSPEDRLAEVVNAHATDHFNIRFLGRAGEIGGFDRVLWNTDQEDDGVFTSELPCSDGFTVRLHHDERKHLFRIELDSDGGQLVQVTFTESVGVIMPEARQAVIGACRPSVALARIAAEVDMDAYWPSEIWWQELA